MDESSHPVGIRAVAGALRDTISLALFGDPRARARPAPSFTMTLEHAPLACDDCLATASAFLADGPFTVRLRDGGDSTAIVVTPDALAPEILAYFGTGLTNARTEGFNNKAKLVKKASLRR